MNILENDIKDYFIEYAEHLESIITINNLTQEMCEWAYKQSNETAQTIEYWLEIIGYNIRCGYEWDDMDIHYERIIRG